MDIEKVRESKIKLEEDILEICKTFSKNTGVEIQNLRLNASYFQQIGNRGSIQVLEKVDIELKL